MKRVLVSVAMVTVWVAVAVQTVAAAALPVARAQAQPPQSGALEAVTIALFLALVANRLVEALIVPIFTRFSLDRFWLLYVGWVMAGLLVAASEVNLFADYIPSPLVGQLLTVVVCGGGGNLISDLFGKK